MFASFPKKIFSFLQNLSAFIFVFYVIYYCEAENDCTYNFCGNSHQHTLCKFETNDPARHCIDHERTIRTDKEKQDILHKINSRRNKVASGEIRSLPSAENMNKMEWNDELESSAQQWVDQCMQYKELDTKDVCRDLDTVHVGQNIATVVGESPGLTPAILVDVWYMELLNMKTSLTSRYRPSNQSYLQHYDYFTQLVWAESNLVGCGGAKFKERFDQDIQNRTINRLVCNFAPGGNELDRSVYNEGLPCTGCPFGGACDSVYTSLCSFKPPLTKQSNLEKNENVLYTNVQKISENIPSSLNIQSHTQKNVLKTFSLEADDENTTFDYFAHLFNSTSTTEKVITNKVITCKDIMPVEDFIELFKKRLLKDEMLKEFFLTSKMAENKEKFDGGYTDASVANLMGQIYSKKELTTTTKSTEPDYFNSTLLVDLVEAVIFKSNDRISPTEKEEQTTNFLSDVSAIKIKAELGEIKANQHLTGHYFFPEEDSEQDVGETTESYYDMSNIPEADIVSEIEDLKRNRGTKDFLNEILESDFYTENIPNVYLSTSIRISLNESGTITKHFDNFNVYQMEATTSKSLTRKKRSHEGIKSITNLKMYDNVPMLKNFKMRSSGVTVHLVNYKDLLRKIASDLNILKLKERFHCTGNASYLSLSNHIYGLVCLFFVLLQSNINKC